jgi:uncharacterized membrane protein YeaQ/YmgE (transglycosylase-associated protein family)
MLMVDGLGWLTWLVVGGLAGYLANAVMRTKRQHRLTFDVVLGLLGALLGGIIFTAARLPANTGFSAFPMVGLVPAVMGFSGWSILVAFITALALLGLAWLFLDVRGINLPQNAST